MSISTFCLFINPKWKNTDIYDALTKIQFRCLLDDDLKLLDFKAGNYGFCYITKQNTSQQTSAEYRKILATVQNNHPNLKIQLLVEYSNKDLFNSIQEFSVVELKYQVIPVETPNDVAQYMEKFMLSELQEDKNPFNKDLTINTNDPNVSSQFYLNCIKSIPKIGDKNAQLLAKTYKNLKTLSNASFDDLCSKIGATGAKSICDFFQTSQ